LWASGQPTKTIGETLGKTKNSIIGMAHRMSLAPRKTRTQRQYGERAYKPSPVHAEGIVRRTKSLKKRVLIYRAGIAVKLLPDTKPQRIVAPYVGDKNMSFMDLGPRNCRWPVGDPKDAGFHFCGADKPLGGQSYCAYHMGLAYEPFVRRAKPDNFVHRLAR